MLGKQSAFLEADGCCSLLFEETLSTSSEYIAKLSVIAIHPPNHGHSKRHSPFPFTHAFSFNEHVVQHTCGAHFLSWSPNLQPKYKKYAFFIVGVIRRFLEANVISANIAEVIRVIYALPGHSYKYTTQSITVECQLKLSRDNSHARTPATIRPLSYNT